MSSDAANDLARWVPSLIAVWRRAKAGPKALRRRTESETSTETLTPLEVKEVAAGIRTLSLGLTRNRALAGTHYMDDPALLGAYLLFYWPVSYAQARSVFTELASRPRSMLDLGSGPGPVAFAGLDAGAKEVLAADRSIAALELARQLAIEASEALATREWSPERSLPEGQFDVISMGHLLNELFSQDLSRRADWLERVLERLRPHGSLVILEPALRETSRALLTVRDMLVARGYAIRAPCLFRGPCPALMKTTDWCHAERSWTMPALTERLAKAAGLHKDTLKMSYLVVTPRNERWSDPLAGRLFRIVSEPLESKGRHRYMGCGPEGRIGLALQEKHRSPANEGFMNLNRGDIIRIGGPTEEKGDGAGLGLETTVERIAWAGQPPPKS
jgi:SAM-dependent methyltransferase